MFEFIYYFADENSHRQKAFFAYQKTINISLWKDFYSEIK
jgi:hypothetical protein